MNEGEGSIPTNLESLHNGEEVLREKAVGIIASDSQLQLQLRVVAGAMNLLDLLRQYDTNDEDFKVIQILGMRMFNAFAASLKLTLSGYHQNSALILRDVLETVFLLDLFTNDRAQITQWRLSEKNARMKEFSPVKVRNKLDTRDGFTLKRRMEIYELFSELASHPTMKSDWMMRPQKNGNAVIGPFIEVTVLETVISEMGRLAIQAGQITSDFFPEDWSRGLLPRLAFVDLQKEWIDTFYPVSPSQNS